MRTRYKIHNKGPEHPYFVTSTVVAWIPVFTHKDHFEILAGSLQYCRGKKGMRLYAYVIMENHIHLIASSIFMLRCDPHGVMGVIEKIRCKKKK
ncbi:MAG: hypothetical protein SWC40_09985 [Thermodesulfobacteriota bacterium]|nr:hypothetical protein [Thermodesulfobacteriota bacterium]